MYLTKEEEKMLLGDYGFAVQKSMEILVALGKIYDAERFVPITSAHVSGVSYANIGKEGLELLEMLAYDGKVCVKTTLNPAGMDLERWRLMGIDDVFALEQLSVIDAYRRMGVEISCTCTPYLIGNRPNRNEIIAWSESSAVVYANSVLACRTNRESGLSALAAAIAGRVPLYGMHLEENRKPTVLANIEGISSELDITCLGIIIGRTVGNGIPYIDGVKFASDDSLKLLSAALGCFSGIPMFYIKGITINDLSEYPIPLERFRITKEDIKSVLKEFDDTEKPDLVFLGCPHLSLNELEKISKILYGKKLKRRLWLCCSRYVKKKADVLGITDLIERSGATVLCDTCPIVAPIKEIGLRSIATNSAKGAWFSRNMNNLDVKLASLEDCIRMVIE